ncbi:DUF6418 domain-containing protein [Rhodoplanes sp. SY1]|uniref:DUF6418 domain-containing protein n=1 Tax=Rhodoplanes sp. SY1 TaxID=3166646 RepID=UPI0038B5C740
MIRRLVALFTALDLNTTTAVCIVGELTLYLLPADGGITTILGAVLFVWFCTTMVIKHLRAFAILASYLFLRLTVLVSGVFIDNRSNFEEIGITSEPTGLFCLLAAYYVFFAWCAARIIESSWARPMVTMRPSPRALVLMRIWSLGLLLFCAALFIYVLVRGYSTGYPLFTGQDRFAFRRMFDDDRLFKLFMGNRVLLSVYFGVLYANLNGRFRILALILSLGCFLISFLFGEKFTSIVYMIFTFLMPIWIREASVSGGKARPEIIIRLIKVALFISALTLPAILYQYGWSANSEAAVEKLKSRISGQGALWYVVSVKKEEWISIEQESAKKELSMLVWGNSNEGQEYPYAGLYRLMWSYMKPSLVQPYLNRGVTLTMGFEANLLQLFGWIGMLFPIALCAGITGLASVYVAYALTCVDPVRLLIAFKLFDWISFGIVQGYLWFVVSGPALGLVILGLFWELLRPSAFGGLPALALGGRRSER